MPEILPNLFVLVVSPMPIGVALLPWLLISSIGLVLYLARGFLQSDLFVAGEDENDESQRPENRFWRLLVTGGVAFVTTGTAFTRLYSV